MRKRIGKEKAMKQTFNTEQTLKKLDKKIKHRRLFIAISAIVTGITIVAMIICIIACFKTILSAPVALWNCRVTNYTDESSLYEVRDTLRLIDKIAGRIAITGVISIVTLIASVISRNKLKTEKYNLERKAYADMIAKNTALSYNARTNTVVPRR